MSDARELIALNIGNTRVQLGRFHGGELVESLRLDAKQTTPIVERVVAWWREVDPENASIVLASVNEAAADALQSTIEDQLSTDVYVAGDDLPIPIGRQLDPETITGVDRLLNAAAAYDCIKQACIVVDAGTAVTVDFIDGEGTFHGGAIAPGARMQLNALHEHTSALPQLDFAAPTPEAFGKSTAQAMLQGVFHGIRGMVWKLVEQYAERYGAYPMVIATGGDAEVLFAEDPLIDRVVNDLTLRGIAVTVEASMRGGEE